MLRRQAPLDAEALGCQCSVCPFKDEARKRLPVGSTQAKSAAPKLIYVAEGPGRDENTTGLVLVGQTGRLNDELLQIAGLRREELYLTNATKCQPPREATEGEFTKAVAACRPGLVAELAQLPPHTPLVAAGGLALAALTGHTSITEFIGVPLKAHEDFGGRQIMPVVHPAAALPHRTPALGQVIVEHLRRAREVAEGTWQLTPDPTRVITDKAGEATILAAIQELWSAPRLGVDVETPMIKKPLDFYVKARRLLNVGIASSALGLAVCVTWYKTSAAVKEAMLALLASDIPKALQNGVFDTRVFAANGIVMNAWTIDTMDVFRLCYPGLPAGLDFISAFLTRRRRWKDQFRELTSNRWKDLDEQEDRTTQAGRDSIHAGYRADEATTDTGGEGTGANVQALLSEDLGEASGGDLPDRTEVRAKGIEKTLDRFEDADEEKRAVYCGTDAFVQDELAGILLDKLPHVHRGQERQAHRHALILASVDMWRVGIPISEVARHKHRVPLEQDLERYHMEATEAAKALGWAVKKTIEFGRRDKVTGVKQFRIEDVEFNPGSTHHITKLLVETYGMRPLAYTETRRPKWDAEVMEYLCGNKDVRVRTFARKVRKYKLVEKELGTYIVNLPVFPDGHIHPLWKAVHANTTRWSSEGPNAQNIPKHLRDMIVALVGYWLAEADFAQLELKIVALRSGDRQWLEIFAKGKDIHRANAAAMFGVLLEDVNDKQRQAAKPTVYCFQYNGAPQTAWAKLQEQEDFKDVTIAQVEYLHKRFFSEHPAIRKFHQECFDAALKGRVVEPFSGHELVTWGFVDQSLDCNFPVQTLGAWLTNCGLLGINAELKAADDNDTKVIAHQHDALWLHGREPIQLVKLLKNNLERELDWRGEKCFFNVDTKVSTASIKEAVEMNVDGKFKFGKSVSGSSTLNGWRALRGVFNV